MLGIIKKGHLNIEGKDRNWVLARDLHCDTLSMKILKNSEKNPRISLLYLLSNVVLLLLSGTYLCEFEPVKKVSRDEFLFMSNTISSFQTSLSFHRRTYGMNETSVNETTMNETSVNETTMNETSVNETTMNETSVNETTMNETSVNETTMNETSVNETTMNETSVNETTMNETGGVVFIVYVLLWKYRDT
ncbi:hypothetical protein LAZ67_22002101 [Cordylochernes scorpioides]|uniref:Uncharacterized protein n=1 Tax=Cordylochernes scorpioides TaxID=51811 RepID=A0ABY6LR87_9ARAC|nr:hypothetical protein LAZ67_22002101 [Cordylochernes scorpioides]